MKNCRVNITNLLGPYRFIAFWGLNVIRISSLKTRPTGQILPPIINPVREKVKPRLQGFSREIIDAAEAVRITLVTQVVSPGDGYRQEPCYG